jgi:predicted PurR-regulated permease PerM
MEKRWTSTTKRTVAIFIVIAVILFISRVSAILSPIIISLILAYILSPIADLVSVRLRVKRTLAVVAVYLVLIAVLITVPALLIPALIDQIQDFIEGVPALVEQIGEFSEQPLSVGNLTLDLTAVYGQASSSIQTILTSMGTQAINILTNIASAIIMLFFILVASFYLVKDSALIARWVEEATPPAYRHDVRELRARMTASWNAFLRGQLILMIVMGLAVGTTMALIGLPNAWLFGLLFGLLEVIPNLGPVIASVPAVLVAYFQGSTVLNISNGWFAVLVIVINFALQQLENNYLVPRIMGQSLHLHPVVVLVAAIIGAQLAGILGILLAAPVVATLRILAEYTYCRLLDLPAFPDEQVPSQVDADDQVTVETADQPMAVSQTIVTTEGEQAE